VEGTLGQSRRAGTHISDVWLHHGTRIRRRHARPRRCNSSTARHCCTTDVPLHIYTNLMNAASVGRAFNAHLRARYKSTVVMAHPVHEGVCGHCGQQGLALTVCLECGAGELRGQPVSVSLFGSKEGGARYQGIVGKIGKKKFEEARRRLARIGRVPVDKVSDGRRDGSPGAWLGGRRIGAEITRAGHWSGGRLSG